MANVCPTTGTYSPVYKRRCLVRKISLLPTKGARHRWLAGYARAHGLAAMRRLMTEVEADYPNREQPIEVPA